MANFPKTIRSLVRTIIPLFGLLYPITFLLAASGLVAIDWYGFGVDSEGNIYIGQKSEICVYEESVCIRTIDIPQYRSYYFTIDHDEILLASPSHVYTFDLNGQMLSKESDPSGRFGMPSTQSPCSPGYSLHNLLPHPPQRNGRRY